MNKIQFLTPKIHGILDYVAAVGLIGFPFLLALEGIALWLSVGGGVGLIGYSLLTDYTYGTLPIFSYGTHLALDITAAIAFFASPFIFGFQGATLVYYFVMGAGVTAVVAFSNPGVGEQSEVIQVAN